MEIKNISIKLIIIFLCVNMASCMEKKNNEIPSKESMIIEEPHQEKIKKETTPENPMQKGESINNKIYSRNIKLSEEYRLIANSIDDHHWIGTMYNEVDLNNHSCFILANKLGFLEAGKTFEVKYQVDLQTKTTENGQDLRITAQSMDNFNLAKEYYDKKNQDEVGIEWNIDCAKGKFAKIKTSTFYKVSENGSHLYILGEIEAGFYEKFMDAINKNPQVEQIVLGSGGGLVYDAIKAGMEIRQRGLDTSLSNNCLSACPLIFAGGVSRYIPSPYPDIGLHRIYTDSFEEVPTNHQVYKDIYRYLLRMGIDADFFVTNMWSHSFDEMNHITSHQDLCHSKIATVIQRSCSIDD